MGCSSSRTADSEAVLQCLKRKRLMRAAVSYRQDFAFAHLSYMQTLRNVGDALCHISEADFSNMQNTPSGSPTVPLPSDLPPPASPPVKAVNSPLIQEPPSTSVDPEASSSFLDLIDSPPSWKGSRMVSSLKGGDFSPYYSPAREELEDVFMAFSLPPPSLSMYAPFSTSPHSSAWDPFNLFHASPISYPLPEQRHTEETQEIEEMGHLDQVTHEEGMSDLEEEEVQQEYEKDQPKQNEKKRHEKEEHTTEVRTSELVEISTEEVLEKQVGNAVVMGLEANVKREKAEEETDNNLAELVGHIAEQFSKAFDSGKELSGIFKTHLVHQHARFWDFRDSFKIFNGITWHQSLKEELNWKEAINTASDEAQCGMAGSHSSTLERLYTWEEKLYNEVKAAELLRFTFDRKCKQMNSLVSKKGNSNLIEKTRAAVRGLDTQITVSLRVIHSASMRIQQLTNEDLYPQLAELLGRLIHMWKEMLDCHKVQKTIALKIKTLDKTNAGDEVSNTPRNATIELEHELEKWRHYFFLWVTSLKKYIYAVFSWLRIGHMDPEGHVKGGAVSPNWTAEIPPIYLLVKRWHAASTCLEQYTEVLDVIKEFAAKIHGLQIAQSELIQKKRVEHFSKDLEHRTVLWHHLEKKYWKSELSKDQSTLNKAFLKTKTAQNSSTNKMKEKPSKGSHESQETALSSLQENLPQLFEALIAFAEAALTEFEKVHKETEFPKYQPMDKGLEQ